MFKSVEVFYTKLFGPIYKYTTFPMTILTELSVPLFLLKRKRQKKTIEL